MIKVKVKETATNASGILQTTLIVREHKSATWALVHNGVLSLYGDGEKDGKAIAGYEPSAWLSWEKV